MLFLLYTLCVYNLKGISFDGLGSLIMSDCQFAPIRSTGACMYVAALAPSAGVQMISNTVFESYETNVAAIYFQGTLANPCKFFQFSNCYLGGDYAVIADYATEIMFTNCYFTGATRGFQANINVTNIVFDACQFQVNNVPIAANTAITTISLSLTDCIYTGTYSCVYLPNLSSSQIGYINVRGGSLGTNANPIYLSDYNNTKKSISAFGQSYGPVQSQIYTGTLDGSGGATIAHGINSGNSRIVSVYAVRKGSSSEALPITVTNFDGTSIVITGGAPAASTNYRVFVQFVQETVAW